MAEPSGFDPMTITESNATSYPEPYRDQNRKRWNRHLGEHTKLTNFGVNLTRIARGGQSSHRHAHTRQDEFIYVLEGEVVLETDCGTEVLSAGMCAGFPAGSSNAHRFLNRSHADVVLLVVGDRTAGDEITYPDVDMRARMQPSGGYRFFHKDGTAF
ncbi:MAG: cupin domain-containing protein [Acetobacteraceae bacterium]